MDGTQLLERLEQLDDEIDDLEEALEPLLNRAIAATTETLPLLDKAKLYVLVTYAIESMLFSYLRLNGVKALEHPVYRELTRVKQYFAKIKTAENPPERTLTLDKGAAARFIKHGLSGNDKYDLERAEREAKEKARTHIKFEESSKKRKAEGAVEPESDGDSDESQSAEPPAKVAKTKTGDDVQKKKKKDKSKKKKSKKSKKSRNAEEEG